MAFFFRNLVHWINSTICKNFREFWFQSKCNLGKRILNCIINGRTLAKVYGNCFSKSHTVFMGVENLNQKNTIPIFFRFDGFYSIVWGIIFAWLGMKKKEWKLTLHGYQSDREIKVNVPLKGGLRTTTTIWVQDTSQDYLFWSLNEKILQVYYFRRWVLNGIGFLCKQKSN